MDQYRPAGKVRGGAYAEIDRRISMNEWSEACRVARGLDLRLDVRGPAGA